MDKTEKFEKLFNHIDILKSRRGKYKKSIEVKDNNLNGNHLKSAKNEIQTPVDVNIADHTEKSTQVYQLE